MKTFKLLVVGLSLVLTLGVPAAGRAGGWAIIPLDKLPDLIIAGEPVAIGFRVLQHGHTPVTGDEPILQAQNLVSGSSLRVVAEAQGLPGHYVALVKFPEAGTWSWSIQGFNMEVTMPALEVRNAGPVVDASPVDGPPLMLGLALLAGGSLLAGGLIFRQTDRRFGAGVMVLGAGLLVFSLALMEFNPQRAAAKPVVSGSAVEPSSQGQNLFMAKGCATCHTHRGLDPSGNSINIGPDLTRFQADPDDLAAWLANPQAVKPGTAMPQLGLTSGEIDALIAFLLAD